MGVLFGAYCGTRVCGHKQIELYWKMSELICGRLVARTTAYVLIGALFAYAWASFVWISDPYNEAFWQGPLFSLLTLYWLLLSRNESGWIRLDVAVLLSVVLVSIATGRRSLLITVVALFVITHWHVVSKRGVIAAMGALIAILITISVFRENFEFQSTLLRIYGNYLRFVNSTSLTTDSPQACFGIGSIFPFADRAGYANFYQYVREPITLPWLDLNLFWDSASLLERITLTTCNVKSAIALLFAVFFLFSLLALATKDIRFQRIVFASVLLMHEGTLFYDPLTTALVGILAGVALLSIFLGMIGFRAQVSKRHDAKPRLRES